MHCAPRLSTLPLLFRAVFLTPLAGKDALRSQAFNTPASFPSGLPHSTRRQGCTALPGFQHSRFFSERSSSLHSQARMHCAPRLSTLPLLFRAVFLTPLAGKDALRSQAFNTPASFPSGLPHSTRRQGCTALPGFQHSRFFSERSSSLHSQARMHCAPRKVISLRARPPGLGCRWCACCSVANTLDGVCRWDKRP